MAISAQSLFHFTSKAENLISILENGFYPCYSLEIKATKFPDELGVPMVSFCDLRLSDVAEHIGFYGNYGIGLKKEWAEKNELNPILYLSNNSTICKCLEAIFVSGLSLDSVQKLLLEKGIISKEKYNLYNENYTQFNLILGDFAKPIFGKMYRNGRYIEKNFYNEREWRYIPKVDIDYKGWRIEKEDFESSVSLAQANAQIAKKYVLKFNIDDIKYIIVSSENDIYSMINAIHEIYKIENDKSRQMLCSRILTVNQISEDF